MGVGDLEPARRNLEEAVYTLTHHRAIYPLATAQMYLARVYLASAQLEKSKAALRYTLRYMVEAGCYELDVWQPWIVGEMCALAVRERIEPLFAERLAIRRLRAEHCQPFFPLLWDSRDPVRLQARYILESLQAGRLKVYDLLRTCKDETTRHRLHQWLDNGWVTELGLVYLAEVMAGRWRRIEVLLVWLSPDCHGSPEKVAATLILKKDTINTHLEFVKDALIKAGVPLPQPQSSSERPKTYPGEVYNAVFLWAIKNHIINPAQDPSAGSDTS